jgi:hypothetical protein
MAEKEVSEALFTLRREIEQLDGTNPELSQRLEGILNELEDRMEATEDNDHLHLVDDMKDALTQFEVEHPRLIGVINDLMVSLSNLGI